MCRILRIRQVRSRKLHVHAPADRSAERKAERITGQEKTKGDIKG